MTRLSFHRSSHNTPELHLWVAKVPLPETAKYVIYPNKQFARRPPIQKTAAFVPRIAPRLLLFVWVKAAIGTALQIHSARFRNVVSQLHPRFSLLIFIFKNSKTFLP